ncbi:MAG: HEAT repeat domain-containing protein [Gemmatimonadales bacterium]
MMAQNVILIVAGVMLAVGLLTVLAWFVYTSYLDRVERRLATRKGLYRDLVTELASRDRALLEPTINQMSTLYDLDALEAVLEEQARSATGRPGWLLEVYDRLGLVDKYIAMLRTARKWRDRAFAAELLGRVGGAKAVPVLLETVNATRTEDSDVREIALRALARIADPGAVEPLIRALATADVWLAPRIADILTRHGDLAVDPLIAVLSDTAPQSARAWAANVLGEVRAQRAFPAIVRALGDPEDEVRAKAATALGRLGDRRAVGYLMEHLLTDPAPFVRLRIASSLGQFGGPEVINRLVRALGDPAWWVRMRSVEALEQVGSAAEGPLLVALDDSDPEIRVRAAAALERLGVPDNLVRTIDAGERDAEASEMLVKFARAGARELLAELVMHSSPQVRQAVVSAVQRSGRGDLAAELIRIAAGDRDGSLRALALETLRTLRVSEALPVALRALADPDRAVRAAAVGAVAELGGAGVIGSLQEQTLATEPAVRAAAARALGVLGTAEAESDLRRLLGDPDPGVREAAVAGTVHARLRSLVPPVVELLGDSDARVRLRAAQAVSQLGDRSVVPVLLRVFPAAEENVRKSIVVAVGRLDPGAMRELLDPLEHLLDSETKLALIGTLRRQRIPVAVEVLERLAGDAEAAIRAAAIEALGRVGRAVTSGLRDPEEMVRATSVDSCSRAASEEHGRDLLSLLRSDPSSLVRERAALGLGLLRLPLAEEALIAACRRAESANVQAAAVLAVGTFDSQSLVELVVEMPDQTTVRELLRQRPETDARFRVLRSRLSLARRLELRALVAPSSREAQASLAEGMRSILDSGERVRLIGSLRAFQGARSRDALLEIVRSDPTPEVRTAGLSAVGDLLDPEALLAVGTRSLGDPSLLVRRAAVALFARVAPGRAVPKLMQALRADDDPAVLAAAAGLAEEHFATFAEVALGMGDGERTALVVRIARHIHHPGLAELLPLLARSGSPEVRASVAELWHHRPEIAHPPSLEALSNDPVIWVRQSAAGAAVAAERYDILERMTQDPDPLVRREVAVVLGKAAPVSRPGLLTLERLAGDADMAVRAAAYVARLLQGSPLPLPPGLDSQVAAQAVLDTADLTSLRNTALTAAGEDQRLSAALALALLQDEVAREVARTDPIPAIRHRVGGALELSIVSAVGATT